MQKSETDADPPWGDGERARKSLLKKYFILLLLVTISEKLNIRNLLVLMWDETKILQLSKILNFSERGDPRGDLNAPEADFEQQILLFSITPDKNQK